MFDSIYVPVDNSEYSNRAIDLGVILGKAFSSKMVGSHVYAAAMHDYRFKQMEFTLPGEYLQEEEIERQRKIHDSLITMGLELISDCYLNEMDNRCKAAGLNLDRRMMDGKHHVEILKDITTHAYPLTVLGAVGIGKHKDGQIGSVCERVVRNCPKDVWVVKHVPRENEVERDTIVIGIDGSPHSFGALAVGVELAQKFGKKLELVSVYDPYLHYAVFNGIVDVLTEKAAKVFRFEEQNQLHEEIIDTGLAQIYQSHLNIGEKLAQERGIEVNKTLLDGKAFQKVLGHLRKSPPWLLILGRLGVHKLRDEEVTIGSTTENLLRLAPCDVYITTRMEYPELDKRADESILWTSQAEEKMKRVPDVVRGIARRAIVRLAIEQGHSVITESVIEDAMHRFMPKYAAKATTKLAEAIAFERARQGNVSICKKCGVTARELAPVKCSVCGGNEFDLLTPELVDQIAKSQGGVEAENTYDGRELGWSQEARKELNSIEDKYQKRRAKARIEKAARTKKLSVISYEFVRHVIDEEIGRDLPFEYRTTKENGENAKTETEPHPFEDVKPLSTYTPSSDQRVVARDQNGVELSSVFSWDEVAVERLFRVPAGFMRQKTQERIEDLAHNQHCEMISLELVEAGIDIGRQMMEKIVSEFGVELPPKTASAPSSSDSKCPFSSMFKDQDEAQMREALAYMFNQAEDKSSDVKTPNQPKSVSHVYEGAPEQVLNEAGIMHELTKVRQDLKL